MKVKLPKKWTIDKGYMIMGLAMILCLAFGLWSLQNYRSVVNPSPESITRQAFQSAYGPAANVTGVRETQVWVVTDGDVSHVGLTVNGKWAEIGAIPNR